MIKHYNFQVSEKEKNRILGLHESATKGKYLSEKYRPKILTEVEDPETEEIKFNISRTFESGQYKLLNTTDIDNALAEFKKFYEDSPESFEIIITSSESKVPNVTVGLKPGDLSRLRAEEVEKYIKSKNLEVKIVREDLGAQGPEWDRTKGSKDKGYTENQFVYLTLKGSIKKPKSGKVFTCSMKAQYATGAALPASANFAEVRQWDIGEGGGNFYLWANSVDVQDILFFVYGGKSYGSRTFCGDKSSHFSIMTGTPLRAKFGNSGNLPKEFFGETTFRDLSIENEQDKNLILQSLPSIKEWGLYSSFYNTFGQGQEFFNADYINALNEYDNSKDSKKSRNRLLERLGSDFPWAIITSPIGDSIQKNIGPIEKIPGENIIKIYNVSPCGTTQWSIGGTCKPF